MSSISNTTNTTIRLAPSPSKELAKALQEIEDYKNGKIKLDSYNSVREMFEDLNGD